MASLDDRTLAQIAAHALACLLDECSGVDWHSVQPEAKAAALSLRNELEAAGYLDLSGMSQPAPMVPL